MFQKCTKYGLKRSDKKLLLISQTNPFRYFLAYMLLTLFQCAEDRSRIPKEIQIDMYLKQLDPALPVLMKSALFSQRSANFHFHPHLYTASR
jgi:hypothetical protein